jgi:hypothetical protein
MLAVRLETGEDIPNFKVDFEAWILPGQPWSTISTRIDHFSLNLGEMRWVPWGPVKEANVATHRYTATELVVCIRPRNLRPVTYPAHATILTKRSNGKWGL